MTQTGQNALKKRKLIATSVASPLASLIGKFVTYPLDTLKTMIQADRLEMKKVTNYKMGRSWDLFKKIYQQKGVKGFYPGVTIAAFGSVIAFSAYMTAYEKCKQTCQNIEFFKYHTVANHLLSGIVAQFISCIFWLPIDIIKERMQVQDVVKLYKYNGPRDAMRKIHKTEGLIGLYRAFGATLVFFGPYSAIFFASFEQIKSLFVKDPVNQTLTESIVCSAGASAFAGLITNPLELVKMRMQIQRADQALKGGRLEQTYYGYRNIFHGLYLVVKNEGLYSLYKGAGLRVLFVVPLTTICVSLTQYFRTIVMKSKYFDNLF